jgi:ferredoxin
MMFPKTKYLRDKKRLEACRALPCQHCGAEDGTVVAAHANNAIYGKGRGIKASDEFVAALCFTCHANLDQGKMSKDEKSQMWHNAHMKTIGMLDK